MTKQELKAKLELIKKLRFFFGRTTNRLLREESGRSKQTVHLWLRNEIKKSQKIEDAANKLIEDEKSKRLAAIESEKAAIEAEKASLARL